MGVEVCLEQEPQIAEILGLYLCALHLILDFRQQLIQAINDQIIAQW